jgi:hypothetical protein
LLKRTTVLYFVLPAIGLGALAFALLQWPLQLGNTAPYSEFPPLGGILIYIVGVFGGVALLCIALVLALFQAERGRHWGWFGGLLAVSILTAVLSGLAGFYFPLAFLILSLMVAAYGLLSPTTSSQSVQANASNPGPYS